MDSTFIEGVAAVVASAIVFCGTVWLLITMITGGRLAYFVVASVTLGVIFIMAIVWSLNPLGPVGEMPTWKPLDIAKSASELRFQPATQYPGGPWREADTQDVNESGQASLLQTSATEYLEDALDTGKIKTFQSTTDALAVVDSIRLLEQGNKQYGAITFEATPGKTGGPAVAVMTYNPGDPLGIARQIAVGSFLLFAAHLFGLSRVERKARRVPQPA